MITQLITQETFIRHYECETWEELVDAAGGLLVARGSVEAEFLQSIKDTVAQYGGYMVLVDDVAFFHGRPEAGVHEVAMSLVLLKKPVYLGEKRIKAAFAFAAVDNTSHRNLLRELAWSLDNDEFLELLRNDAELEEIIKIFAEAEKKHEVS